MFRSIKYVFFLLFLTTVLNSQIYTDKLKLKLDSLLSDVNEKTPGGSIYVEQNNQILYYKSFGLLDVHSQEKFSENTITNMGSFSKVFIAYAILILQEQKKLSIEDTLYKYFPESKNKDFFQKIRIRHILTHTSGLKDLPGAQMDSTFSLTMKDEQNFERVKYEKTLTFEPGNNFQYSDQAFSCLVLIIEKVSKMTWEEFIKLYVFYHSGMRSSKLTVETEQTSNVAHGYKIINKTYKEYDQGECPKMFTATNGGVWSNINDLRKFMNAIKYCQFLKCENIKLSEQILLPNNWYSPQTPPHTFCWFANGVSFNTGDFNIEYAGSTGGYRSHVIFFPEKDLTIICLSNNSTDYSKILLTELYNFHFIK